MDQDNLKFIDWKPKIISNNDVESAKASQKILIQYLTDLHISLENINNNDHLTFVLSQLNELIDYLFEADQNAKESHLFSIQINKIISKTYTFVLSIMLKNAHEKFNISLIDIVNKFNDILISNFKKVSMKNNWYSPLKHLSVIMLQFIFTGFSGFLNTYKNTLLTALYKNLSKCNDNYNSSVENNIFRANFFTDMVFLINIILSHDNSSNTLDEKLFTRLIKLSKFVSQKNTSSNSSQYTYPLTSVMYSYNILVCLLKSDRYLSNLTAKKSSINCNHYLNSISSYTSLIIVSMNTDHKKLKLALSKNLSDLLVFSYIVFGSNLNETDKALEACLNLILLNYTKDSINLEIKSSLIETLIQFISKLNLYYETKCISTNASTTNGVNFVSLKFFEILNIVYYHIFGIGSISTNFKKQFKDENFIKINNETEINSAIKISNHLNIFYSFLIKELDNDVNKLIVLSKLILGDSNSSTFSSNNNIIKIQCLNTFIINPENDISNYWYAISILKFSQLLIDDLNEYILSHQDGISDSHDDIATQLSIRILEMCKNKNFRIRIISTEVLIKILKIKPEICFKILSVSLDNLSNSFDDSKVDNKFMFTENNGYAYLISSILSFCSKSYITTDFVLKSFSLCNNFLKKFNSSVVSTNLFGNNGSGNYISNINYEKQLISWILLMGLFNYANDETGSTSNNFFLQDSSQFLLIWKNLLAHSIPNGFVQIDTKLKKITNISEIMKLIEVKNHALACLISYLTYLSSTRSSTLLQNDDISITSLLTPEISRQINQILNKSYSFINSLNAEIENCAVPKVLEISINVNKLRIYEAFLKLMPFLNIRNEINSTILLDVVKNFTDTNSFKYPFKDDKLSKQTKKKNQPQIKFDEYEIYKINDGINYGLTSKLNGFKVDELMIKTKGIKSTDDTTNNNANTFNDIDSSPLHTLFSIESPKIESYLSDISVFDSTTESRCLNSFCHSILNDSLIFLCNGTDEIGYTDTMKYPVGNNTMIIDCSIEIFATAFSHLSSKVQQSIIETMRTCIFYKSKESKSSESTNSTENIDKPLTLRKKAITINSSVAIHNLLNYMINYNSQSQQHPSLKLKFKPEVVHLIVETLKNISTEDAYLSHLNSDSIGMCCALIEDNREETLANQVSMSLNSLVGNTSPCSRAFDIETLAKLTEYSNMFNTSGISNAIFTLLFDPHPVVHSAALRALDTFICGKSQMEIGNSLFMKILDYLEMIWISDTFGIDSPITISSNINFREYLNSVVIISKVIRTIVNVSGPMIATWSQEIKDKLRNLIFGMCSLVTFDYELVIRELLKAYEELLVFDKSLISIQKYKHWIKFLIVNNFKIGVYGHSLSFLPLDDDYDNENTFELFPATTSVKVWRLALESYYQLIKLCPAEGVADDNLEKVLWIALENDSSNESAKKIIQTLLEDSMRKGAENRFLWFDKLIDHFSVSKYKLTDEILSIFRKRINNGGMFFNFSKLEKLSKGANFPNPATTAGTVDKLSKTEDPDVNFNEAEETLTSDAVDEVPQSKARKESEDDNGEPNNAIIPEDFIHLLDLENEQTSWGFKLYIINMLNNLLSFTQGDSALKMYLSKKIAEFVRVTFICSTSNLITLRVASLKLLGNIIELYAPMKDPLYPDVSILDQQQAQIITAIAPAFNHDSTIELAGEAIVLASKLVSSNITSVNRMNRIVKILTNSLEDLAAQNKINNENDKIIKVGDIPVLTKKSQNKIKVHILQAWARIKISASPQDEQLQYLIAKYISVLIPLWIYSLRDFAMLKYGSDFNIENEDGTDLLTYQTCWSDFLDAVCMVIEENPDSVVQLLSDDIGNFFFIIFGQCIEYLVKLSSKSYITSTESDLRVLHSLRRLLKIDLAMNVLFRDVIFTEFIDLMDRLISISDDQMETNIIELSKSIFDDYFKTIALDSTKTAEQLHSDVDKLFELIRLNMQPLIKLFPFIRDREINMDKLNQLEGRDLILVKKSITLIIEMINQLPSVIQIDLYSCILYIFTLIYQLNNTEIISILLPSFKRTLSNFVFLSPNNTNLISIYKIISPQISNSSTSSLLTIFIITTTIPDVILDESDIVKISESIVEGVTSKDRNVITLATQTIKTLIKSSTIYPTYNQILSKLIPLLIDLLTSSSEELEEPRLILEVLITLVRSLVNNSAKDEQVIASYELTLPILVYFTEKYTDYTNYSIDKLMELIELNPKSFKQFIQNCDNGTKIKIEELVKKNVDNDKEENLEEIVNNVNIENATHIQLKTFG